MKPAAAEKALAPFSPTARSCPPAVLAAAVDGCVRRELWEPSARSSRGDTSRVHPPRLISSGASSPPIDWRISTRSRLGARRLAGGCATMPRRVSVGRRRVPLRTRRRRRRSNRHRGAAVRDAEAAARGRKEKGVGGAESARRGRRRRRRLASRASPSPPWTRSTTSRARRFFTRSSRAPRIPPSPRRLFRVSPRPRRHSWRRTSRVGSRRERSAPSPTRRRRPGRRRWRRR